MEKKTIWDLHRLSVEEFKTSVKTPLCIIVDNVRSLNNIGSIFRTADCFALERVILCGISATPPSNEIHKTALGAEDSMDWTYYERTIDAVHDLQSQGCTVCCLEQVKDSVPLQDFEVLPDAHYALVVGNEVDGVDPDVVNACDVCIEIPQCGTKHSLNVSVSTGIAIWQFFSSLRGLQSSGDQKG